MAMADGTFHAHRRGQLVETTMRTRRGPALVVLVVASVALLAACSSDDAPESSSDTTRPPPSRPTARTATRLKSDLSASDRARAAGRWDRCREGTVDTIKSDLSTLKDRPPTSPRRRSPRSKRRSNPSSPRWTRSPAN